MIIFVCLNDEDGFVLGIPNTGARPYGHAPSVCLKLTVLGFYPKLAPRILYESSADVMEIPSQVKSEFTSDACVLLYDNYTRLYSVHVVQ